MIFTSPAVLAVERSEWMMLNAVICTFLNSIPENFKLLFYVFTDSFGFPIKTLEKGTQKNYPSHIVSNGAVNFAFREISFSLINGLQNLISGLKKICCFWPQKKNNLNSLSFVLLFSKNFNVYCSERVSSTYIREEGSMQ